MGCEDSAVNCFAADLRCILLFDDLKLLLIYARRYLTVFDREVKITPEKTAGEVG